MFLENSKKYFYLLYSFWRTSVMADFEYRMNLVVKVFTDVLWYAAQLSLFEVLFRQTTQIAGWDLQSMRVFMGVLFLVDALWMLLFWENLDTISEKVRKGELDLLLMKPVDSLFMLSFRRINAAYVINIFIVLFWLVWSLQQVPGGFSFYRLWTLIVLVPCALAITYGMRFLFAAQAVRFVQAENLNYVWYQLYRLGTRPDSLYPSAVRYVVLFLVPVGFIASVPARMVLFDESLWFVLCAVIFAVMSIYLSRRYWRYVLRFYSSASS